MSVIPASLLPRKQEMMDPNETLRQIRHSINCKECEDDLAELFESLDKWLSSGGFLPSAWEKHRRATL